MIYSGSKWLTFSADFFTLDEQEINYFRFKRTEKRDQKEILTSFLSFFRPKTAKSDLDYCESIKINNFRFEPEVHGRGKN